jgi:hypothetical protein
MLTKNEKQTLAIFTLHVKACSQLGVPLTQADHLRGSEECMRAQKILEESTASEACYEAIRLARTVYTESNMCNILCLVFVN